jgi:hypothetical protein
VDAGSSCSPIGGSCRYSSDCCYGTCSNGTCSPA